MKTLAKYIRQNNFINDQDTPNRRWVGPTMYCDIIEKSGSCVEILVGGTIRHVYYQLLSDEKLPTVTVNGYRFPVLTNDQWEDLVDRVGKVMPANGHEALDRQGWKDVRKKLA